MIYSTGLVIPAPAVIVSLSAEKYNYKLNRFPPFLCTSNAAMWFYSIIFIFDVLVGIGVYLLFVVFWIIHRYIHFYKFYNYYDCCRNLFSIQNPSKIKAS